MRRGERQHRAWHRHVRTTVAMELATALHHSAQPAGTVVVGPSEGEVRETYDALRRLKAPLPGKRPGVPPAPEAQGAAVTGGYVAAGAPLLMVPTLHNEDSVDSTTVSLLLAENLKLTKKEEEKERRRKLREEVKHATHIPELDRRKKAGARLSAPDDDAWREWKSVSLGLPSREVRMSKGKRKKRRRKKLPKSSLARAPRTWKPGHYFYCPGRSFVFLRSFSAQHLVRQWIQFHAPGFVVLWKLPRSSSSTAVVWLAGFACAHVPRAVFPSIVSRFLRRKVPRSSSTTAVARSWLVLLVRCTPCCVLLFSSGPRCSASWSVWT